MNAMTRKFSARLLFIASLHLPSLTFNFLAHRYVERFHEHKAAGDKLCQGDPKPKAEYHLIPASLPIEQVVKKLEKLCKQGKLLSSPDCCVTTHEDSLVAFNTDSVLLVPARAAPCHQAALMFATGCTCEQLGAPTHGIILSFLLNSLMMSTPSRCTSTTTQRTKPIVSRPQ